MMYQDSITNPTTSADLTSCSELCGKENQLHHKEAITFLVDTPLRILLKIQEPPSNPPPPSHLRHLSTFYDWRGILPRYDYSLVVLLQPGINHIMWCKGVATGMEASFSPPLYGDWPTISPHPITPQHDLNFYSHTCVDQKYHLTKVGTPCPNYSSSQLTLSKQPSTLALYYVKGTVPSLMITASLAVIGRGYLLPDRDINLRIPHRLIDETYHPLRICGTDGTIVH
jgi:hypothetical protein